MATQEAGTARTQGLEDEGLASQVQQQVQDTAHDLKGQASRNVRSQLDERSTEFGEQVHSPRWATNCVSDSRGPR
jgi:hypothetical protein